MIRSPWTRRRTVPSTRKARAAASTCRAALSELAGSLGPSLGDLPRVGAESASDDRLVPQGVA